MYCRTCGKENPEGTTECSTCGCNPTEGNMYCPECGHFCLPGDSQCVNCGYGLADAPSLKKTITNEVSPIPVVDTPIDEPVAPEPAPVVSEPEPVAPEPGPVSLEPEPDVYMSAPMSETAQPQGDTYKKYCRNCGLIIEADSLRCPYCDAVANTGTQYCPKCGMTTSPQDTTCAYCGEQFGVAPDLGEAQPQTQTYTQYDQQQQYYQPQAEPTGPTYISSEPPAQQKTSYNNNNYNNTNYGNTNYGNTNYNRTPNGMPYTKGSSFLVTLLLCLFLGYLGIHRFYTKNWVAGVLQFFTGGGCGIWWLIDLILIVAGTYRDGDGRPLDRDV